MCISGIKLALHHVHFHNLPELHVLHPRALYRRATRTT
jgi:hypothetical protein